MLDTLDVTVGLGKGGAIKSTTSVMTALAIHRLTGKRVAVIDADPLSQSAMDWSNLAGPDWPPGVAVFAWHDENMRARVKAVKDDYPYVIRDTGGDRPRILRDCLLDTDLLLAPVAPNGPDFRRLPATLGLAQEIAETSNPSLAVLITMVKASQRDPDTRDVLTQLGEAGVAVAATMIPTGKAYVRAFGTVPRNLLQYEALAAELLDDEEAA